MSILDKIKGIFKGKKKIRYSHHIGRNDPCPCGSGKKFKKCCYDKMKQKKWLEETSNPSPGRI